MTDRLIRSTRLALLIASLGLVPACETSKPADVPSTAATSSALTTGLQPGDVAVTCINSITDQVQFVSFVALDAGSDLKFTDREWTGTAFNTGETADYLIPLPAIPVGGQFSFVPGGGAPTTGGIGADPEQAFLYQGSIAPDGGTLSLLWGFQMGNNGAWGTPPLGTDISALPAVLNGASPANLALGSSATGPSIWVYTGVTTGTRAQLLAAIRTTSNWTGPGVPDGGAAPACPGNFTVLADATDAGGDVPTGAGGADAGAGAGGAAGTTGTDAGAAGMTGTVDASGAAGAPGTDSGAVDTGVAVDSGAAGAPGTDARTDTGAAGATGSDASVAVDAGPVGPGDARADTGAAGAPGTDARTDTGAAGATGTDARPDAAADVRADSGAGGTGAVDAAHADVRPADGKTDGATVSGGGSGCSCSTAVAGRDGMGTGAWLLAVAGILFTARRRRRS